MDFFLNDVGAYAFSTIFATRSRLMKSFSRVAVNSVNKLDPSIQIDYSAFEPYGDPKVQLKDVWGVYAHKHW
jgi:hypothetical protein